MGIWQVDADTLAGSRFIVSRLAEATASLKKLAAPVAAHPGERRWLDTHLPAYRARLAAEPTTALLLDAAFGARWIADFMTPTPDGAREDDLADGLARIRATPPAAVRADLAVSSPARCPTRSPTPRTWRSVRRRCSRGCGGRRSSRSGRGAVGSSRPMSSPGQGS